MTQILPRRNHRSEEAEKTEVRLFRFVIIFFVVGILGIFFLPARSNLIIPLITLVPLLLTILWGIVFPVKSSYELRWAKELEERRERWGFDE
jgi:hypothetical protein